jgi:hypothetical protein
MRISEERRGSESGRKQMLTWQERTKRKPFRDYEIIPAIDLHKEDNHVIAALSVSQSSYKAGK